MNLKIYFFVFTTLLSVSLFSQNQEDVLLTIDETSITSQDFLNLYNKNLDLVKDENQKNIDAYLELFINYQLKLKEARRLGLHKEAKYKKEFSSYKKQLIKNYLSESKVTEVLVKEAYDRMRFDIKAQHLLILNNPEEQDTLIPYNEILKYRALFVKEGFEAAKNKFHNGHSVLVEDLGYFSAFKMVYDFESAAYNTEPGSVSMPFKTSFGYHIVKVDDKRLSRGTATVAHIMTSLKQKDSLLDPEIRINEIYKKLQQGESFEALAKQFSDDKSSAKNGGELRPFKSGQLSSVAFEDAAFNIENEGAIVKPLKTDYGWHIIKLLKKEPIPDFESSKINLQNKIKRDSRSKLISSAMVKELSERYTVKISDKTELYFNTLITPGYFAGQFTLPADFNAIEMAISVNETIYTNNHFASHLKARQRTYMRKKMTVKALIEQELKDFIENSVLQYREDNLENENEEFAEVLKEYRDGLLLFELMEREIWNKASKDTTGLKTYYNKNTSKYIWKDRVDLIMASASNEKTAKAIQKLFKKGNTEAEIKSKLNTLKAQRVIFTKGVFEVPNETLPEKIELNKGISKVYNHNQGYHVLNILDVLPSQIKTLKETRGAVINDYQNYVETEWLKGLKKRFKVNVNTTALEIIKSKI